MANPAPKVLIGCVTYDKDSAYLESFLKSIREQQYTGYDLLFVDTSTAQGYDAVLRSSGAIVTRDSNDLDKPIKKITGGRAKVREHFLEHGYDYLFFVDTDVVLPKDALARLIADQKDAVGGIYLAIQNIQGKKVLLPVVADFTNEADSCRPMALWEVLNDRVKEVAWIGFGCMLISRKVLEKVSFRYYEKSMSGEDVAFCVDARKAGFKVFGDFGVKCQHNIFPPGDCRNKDLDFEKYRGMTGTFK
jgi:glycosyltransferase involved in cell wall biosynthesis